MVDADEHRLLQRDYDKLKEQMGSLTMDFTTMNAQLMDIKSQNYDMQTREDLYKSGT